MAVLQEHFTGLGQADMAAGAVQQLHAELAFQRLDRLRQRRLRHVQPLRRPAEVQLFGDGEEVAGLPDFHIKTYAS